jgi:hypothetical protein
MSALGVELDVCTVETDFPSLNQGRLVDAALAEISPTSAGTKEFARAGDGRLASADRLAIDPSLIRLCPR